MGWMNSVTDLMDLSLSKLSEIVKDREACPSFYSSIKMTCITLALPMRELVKYQIGL